MDQLPYLIKDTDQQILGSLRYSLLKVARSLTGAGQIYPNADRAELIRSIENQIAYTDRIARQLKRIAELVEQAEILDIPPINLGGES